MNFSLAFTMYGNAARQDFRLIASPLKFRTFYSDTWWPRFIPEARKHLAVLRYEERKKTEKERDQLGLTPRGGQSSREPYAHFMWLLVYLVAGTLLYLFYTWTRGVVEDTRLAAGAVADGVATQLLDVTQFSFQCLQALLLAYTLRQIVLFCQPLPSQPSSDGSGPVDRGTSQSSSSEPPPLEDVASGASTPVPGSISPALLALADSAASTPKTGRCENNALLIPEGTKRIRVVAILNPRPMPHSVVTAQTRIGSWEFPFVTFKDVGLAGTRDDCRPLTEDRTLPISALVAAVRKRNLALPRATCASKFWRVVKYKDTALAVLNLGGVCPHWCDEQQSLRRNLLVHSDGTALRSQSGGIPEFKDVFAIRLFQHLRPFDGSEQISFTMDQAAQLVLPRYNLSFALGELLGNDYRPGVVLYIPYPFSGDSIFHQLKWHIRSCRERLIVISDGLTLNSVTVEILRAGLRINRDRVRKGRVVLIVDDAKVARQGVTLPDLFEPETRMTHFLALAQFFKVELYFCKVHTLSYFASRPPGHRGRAEIEGGLIVADDEAFQGFKSLHKSSRNHLQFMTHTLDPVAAMDVPSWVHTFIRDPCPGGGAWESCTSQWPISIPGVPFISRTEEYLDFFVDLS